MIQKRLDLLGPYFRGIKVSENYKIVEFNLKKSWVIQQREGIDLQQKEVKEGGVMYTMFYSDQKSLDQILDYVEEDIIKYNLELEEKENLLRAKVEELKRVFEDRSLDELNNLKFTTEDNSLKLNGTNLNNKKNNISKNGVTEELSTDSKSN